MKKIKTYIYQKYLWLDNTTLLGFYDKDNNFARFTYAIDRTPLKMDYKGATHYLIYDRLGSLRAVSGANAQRFIKQIDYDSFGNIIRDDNYDATGKLTDNPILDLDIPLGFAGGLYDRHTNLVRFGFRDYDPNTGRWTAKDPIDFNGEQSNLYVYVGNDPINYIDPDGLVIKKVIDFCWNVIRRINSAEKNAERADGVIEDGVKKLTDKAEEVVGMCDNPTPKYNFPKNPNLEIYLNQQECVDSIYTPHKDLFK